MGKCMSAASEDPNSGQNNTQQLIPSPKAKENAKHNDHKHEQQHEQQQQSIVKRESPKPLNRSKPNGQTNHHHADNNIDPNRNAGSLSESDDDETEHDAVKSHTDTKQAIAATKSDEFKTEKKRNQESRDDNIQTLIHELTYIAPTDDELQQQQELELAHIAHRGHFLNECEYSAQNMLQHNDTHYVSLKGYNFSDYDDDFDWVIFKICSNHLVKLTSISLSFAAMTFIEQYPCKIGVQFKSSNSLKHILSNNGWSELHMLSPYPLSTSKPADRQNAHCDTLTVSICDRFLKELMQNKQDQYVRVVFMEAFNERKEYDGDQGKFAVHRLRLFGVELMGGDEEKIVLENTVSKQAQNKNYTVDVSNDFQSKLAPKPGVKDARVVMKEHIFFVSVENKTVAKLKEALCEEYNMFTQGDNTYKPQQFLLIDSASNELINDIMDSTILNKTLKQIGVKKGPKNTGYYLSVAFV